MEALADRTAKSGWLAKLSTAKSNKILKGKK